MQIGRVLVFFGLLQISAGIRIAIDDIPSSRAEACPKVFVYNLPKQYQDYDGHRDKPPWNSTSTEGAIFMRGTSQYGLGEGVLWRVAHSKRCKEVTNPADADLFIIPILAGAKSGSKWETACKEGKITEADLMKQLPHLTEETAHRHVVFVGKGHPNAGHSGCDAWWRKPQGLLKKIWRLSYSENFDGKGQYGEEKKLHHTEEYKLKQASTDFDRFDDMTMDYENLRSVPYMSDFHWSQNFTETPPWKSTEPRPLLMAFFGTIKTKTEYSKKIRPFISKKCGSYGKACKEVMGSHMDMFKQKQATTFCLEPAGDSPYRKSISETLLAGCIPVFFSLQTDSVAPWHWGDWKDNARVFIAADELYSGKKDLKKELESIPKERIQQMQKTIAENAHKMQYALDDMPGDAVEVILRHVAGWDKDQL